MYILLSRAGNGVIKESNSYREIRDFYLDYIKKCPDDQCGVFSFGSQSSIYWNFGA